MERDSEQKSTKQEGGCEKKQRMELNKNNARSFWARNPVPYHGVDTPVEAFGHYLAEVHPENELCTICGLSIVYVKGRDEVMVGVTLLLQSATIAKAQTLYMQFGRVPSSNAMPYQMLRNKLLK